MRIKDKRLIRPFKTMSALCLILILMAFASSSSATVIDSFSTAQSLNLATVGSISSSVSSTAGDILGIERDMTLEMFSGSAISVQADLGGFSILDQSQNSATTGKTTITWDGVDGSPSIDYTGLGGVDLTNGGDNNAIIISVLFDDLPAELIISAYTNGGNWSKYTASLPGLIFASPATVVMAFDDFVVQSGSGVDFTDIGAISLVVNGTLYGGTDMMIDNVETNTVPEPSTLILLGAGFIGIFLTARKKALSKL